MQVNLENFRNAIASLRLILDRCQDESMMQGLDSVLQNAVRAGVIKHFEFTYEQSWLSIKKWLEINVSPDTGDGVSRRELFRLASEQRLIDDVDCWMRYHRARNQTSHTYREATANEVYAVIPEFVEDAQRLLAALEARND